MDQGSLEDFDHFVANRRGDWVRAAMRILRNSADAEDVVQDTLISVWRQWQKASLRNPEGYISRAVTINALRRRSRLRIAVPLDSIAEPSVQDDSPPPMDPMDLERAIANLSKTQQAVVRAKYYVGLTFNQIGRNLSVSSNTAASRCRYALAALRRRLGVLDETEPEKNKL